MNIYVPDYYPEFHCVASRCGHTCCAGWEIDIDAESLARYDRMPGEFGARVRAGIRRGETPQFRLTAGERCPLLNADNLCELILHAGEGALCQICRDHPRFRNYFSDRVEMGLGLVCEEAARLILSRPRPLRLIRLEGSGAEAPTEDERWLLGMAERYGMGVSGGSDYHGTRKTHISMGSGTNGNLAIPYDVLERLKMLHRSSARPAR